MDLVEQLVERLGATGVRPLDGGEQSRVFEVMGRTPRMVVKVQDASMVDRALLELRVETAAELARAGARVCRPLPIDDRLVTVIGGGHGDVALVTGWAYADGAAPKVGSPHDSALMGRALAELHRSMRAVAPRALPLVAALATVPPDGPGPRQLLHGDFNAGNVRIVDGDVRIFDLDDCGYGPPAFDVANALYMVRFDDLTGRRTGAYAPFRDGFLVGYRSVAGDPFDDGEVDGFIDRRVDALESWLDHPATAPVGIRTSTADWHGVLRSFIDTYRAQPG